MELLFKRGQGYDRLNRTKFKLWAKIELTEDENKAIFRYDLSKAILIDVFQPKLLKEASFVGGLAFLFIASLIGQNVGILQGLFLGVLAGCGAGFVYFTQKRETIFVRDLIEGRYFSCPSVIELARKEAWLHTVVSYFQQVIASSKHWDGTEKNDIVELPKDEARQVILKGL